MNTKETSNERTYKIVDGPNRDTLFDSCKYAYDDNANVQVRFSVPIAYTMPKDNPGCLYIAMEIRNIRIASLEHEDGSGASFNIFGYCEADKNVFGKDFKAYRFRAYYNSRTREGTIAFF